MAVAGVKGDQGKQDGGKNRDPTLAIESKKQRIQTIPPTCQQYMRTCGESVVPGLATSGAPVTSCSREAAATPGPDPQATRRTGKVFRWFLNSVRTVRDGNCAKQRMATEPVRATRLA
jgi:hypothetical protein